MNEEIRAKVGELRAKVGAAFVARQDEVDLAVSALVANEHVILIGNPGCAKTAVVEQVMACISGAEFFTTQLFAETSPADVFGQVSVKALQEEDVNRRNTKGHLPCANVAYLDEIFQARSSILVGCNRIMQERRYMDGCSMIDVPLRCMFGSSNMFPEDRQLAAFWDRFTYRKVVSPLESDDDITKMLMMPDPSSDGPLISLISLDELDQAHVDAMTMPVSNTAVLTLIDLFKKFEAAVLEKTKFAVKTSDRKRKKALKAMKVQSYLDGADSVSPFSVGALVNVLWERPEHVAILKEVLNDYAVPNFDDVKLGLAALTDDYNAVASQGDKTAKKRLLTAVFSKVQSFRDDVLVDAEKKASAMGSEYTAAVRVYRDEFNTLTSNVLKDMGLDVLVNG